MTEINAPEKKNSKKFLKEIFDFLETTILFVVPSFILMTFYLHNVKVDGASMEPTLKSEDDLIVVSYIFSPPKSGDIVVVTGVEGQVGVHNIIKRIIATPGQKVKIDFEKSEVYVDGVLLKESYIKEPTKVHLSMKSNEEILVSEDCYFVMGDNRNNSNDSRDKRIGLVKKEQIMGKAKFRKWPLVPVTFF